MRTLNISISDLEYSKFGIPSERLSFSEFINFVSRELARQSLHETVEVAERTGLSNLTISKIAGEVAVVRGAMT